MHKKLERPWKARALAPLALALVLALAAGLAPAALAAMQIYVRPGGSDINCNGTQNVDYPGSGGPGLNCAVQTIQKGIDLVDAGGTVSVAAGTYAGGLSAGKSVSLNLDGCTVTGPAPGLTISADDVAVSGPIVIDGGGSAGGVGIRVLAGADNVVLTDAEVMRWTDGILVEGSVVSFKIGNSFIHNNSGAGLRIGSGVTSLDGNITVDGNLFKDNVGPGIQNDSTVPLVAEYNSWGDQGGPAGPLGDGVGSGIDYEPWTFAEFFLDMEYLTTGTDEVERWANETTTFGVALKADAANLYSLGFQFSYDSSLLTLKSSSFSSPWQGNCTDFSPGAGVIAYFCVLSDPTPEWTADGGTIATFKFSAFSLPDANPVTTYLDISHVVPDIDASAKPGQKVFVNNAGYNDPTIAERTITDTDDGRIIIKRAYSRCEPEWVQADSGEEASLCIYVQDVAGLYGVDFEMNFAGMVGVATVVDEDPEADGVQILQNTTFLSPPWGNFLNTADNSTGYLHYRASQRSPTEAKTGSGPIACVRFLGTTPGEFYMSFSRHQLSTRDGILITDTAHQCRVTFNNPTSVEVTRFAARPRLQTIRVKWKTSQEIDNVGFNLYRSTTRAGEREKLNAELIPTKVPPGSAFGATYTWRDTTVTPGQGYFYWLEAVDDAGGTTQYGPAKARANP